MPSAYPQPTLNLRELLSVFFAGFIPIFVFHALCPEKAATMFTLAGNTHGQSSGSGVWLATVLILSIPVGYLFNPLGHLLLGRLASRCVRRIWERPCLTKTATLGDAQVFETMKRVANTGDTARLLHISTMLCQSRLKVAYAHLERIEGLYILLRSLVVSLPAAFALCAILRGEASTLAGIIILPVSLTFLFLSILVEAFLMYRRAFIVTATSLIDRDVRTIMDEFMQSQ